MKTKAVSREFLEGQVQKAMARIPVGTIFISGVRKIKDFGGTHQMMLEVVQLKDLDVAGENMLSEYLRCIRVSLKMTKEGYEGTFPQLARQISGEELHKLVGQLEEGMVLSIFIPFNEIALRDRTLVKPTIAVRQYADRMESNFPSRIAVILDIDEADRTEQQDEELKVASIKSKDGERLVDVFGRQVYEINELTYGEEDNILIDKIPFSQYSNFIFDIKNCMSTSDQLVICKYLSKNEAFSWTLAIIERYSDKWDWDALSKNTSIPWTLQLINKYADKLSCSEPIWNTLKPYIDDKLIEETFKEINKI